MDPFVVVSFGQVFQMCVIRHSLNPMWDEKLLFHVRASTSDRSACNLTSSIEINSRPASHVGKLHRDRRAGCNRPEKDPDTGLYPEYEDGPPSRSTQTAKRMLWESKHAQIITPRCVVMLAAGVVELSACTVTLILMQCKLPTI
ncbi:hypothetical protein DFH94DRAFT_425660 [Russula ochroleuca]|jgi:phosphatidylserine decarboxylase|uniref:C2 domain-containing protein n=1 Tax=Russula ochroleuca TaxID=152965 RepID=A0A9P5JVL6_9AGAM|nr:hypothetical protein DFH94DRAFT_425660 [Russula ochroleuca]